MTHRTLKLVQLKETEDCLDDAGEGNFVMGLFEMPPGFLLEIDAIRQDNGLELAAVSFGEEGAGDCAMYDASLKAWFSVECGNELSPEDMARYGWQESFWTSVDAGLRHLDTGTTIAVESH